MPAAPGVDAPAAELSAAPEIAADHAGIAAYPRRRARTGPAKTAEPEKSKDDEEGGSRVRNVIFVGVKPIMTYVTATLTQLSSEPTVTIKARGKRITQAVDVSQMIVKRMDTVGYKVSDVRIASDSLTSQDGKQRNVSTIEIDISKT